MHSIQQPGVIAALARIAINFLQKRLTDVFKYYSGMDFTFIVTELVLTVRYKLCYIFTSHAGSMAQDTGFINTSIHDFRWETFWLRSDNV